MIRSVAASKWRLDYLFGWLSCLMSFHFLPLLAYGQADVSDIPGKSAAKLLSAELFGLTKIHHFDLEITAKDYEAMQPAEKPARFKPEPEGEPGLANIKKIGENHYGESFIFPWVRARLVADGTVYKDVGLRYKGQYTYKASRNLLKRSLKIDLKHFENGHNLGSLNKITLNAGVLDPGRCREALAYGVFRAAGVPAPRTAFAEVTLTIPGRFDHEYLGLYTMVEDFDKPFLKAQVKDSEGVLMKPGGARGADYFGENWERYKGPYNPSRELSADEAKHFIAYARLVNQAEPGEFQAKISDYLDVEEFLRYLAVTAMIVNLDGPLVMPQNYMIYLPSKADRKLIFMPWDLDLAFAAWPLGGSPATQMNWNLLHPHKGEQKLIERLLSDPATKARYVKILRELSATVLSEAELTKSIEAVEAAIRESLDKEGKAVAARQETEATINACRIAAQAPTLHTFAAKRCASIRSQLSKLDEAPASAGGL